MRGVLAIALAVLVTGCGSCGPTHRQQIETTLLTYYKSFGSGASAGACQELSKETIAQLEKPGAGKDCTEILDAALKRPDYAAIASKLKNTRVTRITVSNDKATAQILVPGVKNNGALGVRTTVPLLKERGAWKIFGAPQ